MNNHKKQYTIIILIFTYTLIQNAIAFQQVKTHTVADGLLDAVVPVIFQDSRGMLWFGSEQGGVSKFDGKTITAYGAISENFYGRTQNIVEDRWGHIWFLNKKPAQETGVIIRYNGNTFEYFTDGNCLIADKDGNIWISNNNIITRYTATNSQEIPKAFQLNVGGESGANINVIFQSRDRTIWMGGSDAQGALILRLQGEINVGQAVNLSRFNNLPNLPHRSIQSIAQDAEDNLWFGGKSLLLRYDGTQFEQFIDTSIETQTQDGTSQKPIILNRDSVSVKSDTQGRIWYSDNKQLRWGDGNNLHRLGTLSVEANQETYLHGTYGIEDARGRLWFATETGVHLYENNTNGSSVISNSLLKSTLTDTTELTHKVFQVNDGLGSDNILTIFEAIDGTIWFGHDNGVTELQPQPAIVQYGTRSILGSSSVKLMFPDSMETLWLSIPGGVARYVPQDDELYKYPLPNITLEQDGNTKIDRPTEIVEIFEIDGDLWFLDKPIQLQNGLTHHRIFRYTNGGFHKLSIQINAKIGQNGEPVFSNPKPLVSLGTDTWFALNGWLFLPTKNGLHLLLQNNTTKRLAFNTIETLSPSPDNIIAIHTDNQNRLWSHLDTGEVKRYTNTGRGNTQAVGKIQVEKLSLNSVIPIPVEPKNKSSKWFYNTKNNKLMSWENPQIEISIPSDNPPLIVVQTPPVSPKSKQNNTERTNKAIELATFVFKNSIKTYRSTELLHESSVEIDKINASLIATDGDIWLATSHGAIRYNSQEVTTYTKADGFIVDDLRDVKEDNWGNIWFATWGGGLIRYNGITFETITTNDGLIHNNVSSIHVSVQEDLWFGTEGGATQYRVSRGALPFCRIISVNTGKHTTETLLTESDRHTITKIPELIPARNKYLTIRLQGISPLGGDVVYKFRLIGIDNNEWTTVYPNNPQGYITTFNGGIHQSFLPQAIGTSQDFPRIRYEGLKPGNYTFLIKAYRDGWHYTQQPSVLNFTIDKPLWTRWRTYLPYIIVLAVVSTLLFRLIVNRRHTAQLRQEMRQKEEAEIQRIRDELNEAQNIQMALLPTEPPQTQSYDIAGKSIPATQVGGDFFDYLTVANGQTAIAVADAAGKGIRGAMNAVLTNGMLNEIARIKSDANVILRELNIGLAPRMYGHNFIALNLAILDENGKCIDYANGGQPYPILKRGTEIIELTNGDLPLGSMKKADYESVTYDFKEGDILIIHSDGLIEALNPNQEMYGTERLIDLTAKLPNDCSAEEVVQHIVQDVEEFVEDAEQYDDLTLVVVKCTAATD